MLRAVVLTVGLLAAVPAIAGETPPWLRHARTMSTWSLPFARVTREA